jgi:transcriptional regulator with XRE-family HTH domain
MRLITPETTSTNRTNSVLSAVVQRRPRNFIDNPPNRLRRLRIAAGISLPQLAEATGLSREVLRRRETGERQLKAHELELLARALDCHPMEILGQVSELTPRQRALLKLLDQLSTDKQDTLLRLGDALVEPQQRERPDPAKHARR